MPEPLGPQDPGNVTLRRLNRAEYNNTVRDLLGTSLTPANEFPIDDRGAGFDNIATVLNVSPLHLEAYHHAASTLIGAALADPEQRSRLLPCDLDSEGESCAERTLSSFLPRAYRRSVTQTEVANLSTLVSLAVSQGDSIEHGLSLALQAALVSPHFLYRVELDPSPTDLTPHPLNPYELASRLSYFLWSSMPDEPLFEKAANGTLRDLVVLAEEASRMIEDEKAQTLVENFAAQWLLTRSIEGVTPDPQLFPTFDEPLRRAFRAETEELFREVAFGTRPFTELLTADYSFINDRLASHYGLPQPGSNELLRTSLGSGVNRRGLLGHGGILSVTSHPTHTSPVNRGKWVTSELLCLTVPPAPPNVDTELGEEGAAEGATLRERLARHREDPACAACHMLMDPIGLGLENFDAVGAYRSTEGTSPIDSSGTLPDGRSFSGAEELATLIASDPAFASCVVSKLYTFALGREPVPRAPHLDAVTLAALRENFTASGYSFRDLLKSIVLSPTFIQRRGDPQAAQPLEEAMQ